MHAGPRMQQIQMFRRLALRDNRIGLPVAGAIFLVLSVAFGIVLASTAVRDGPRSRATRRRPSRSSALRFS